VGLPSNQRSERNARYQGKGQKLSKVNAWSVPADPFSSSDAWVDSHGNTYRRLDGCQGFYLLRVIIDQNNCGSTCRLTTYTGLSAMTIHASKTHLVLGDTQSTIGHKESAVTRNQIVKCSVAASLLIVLGVGTSNASSTDTLPPSTAIPVQFTRSIDARRAKQGDLITARTMQEITLPDGQILPKNSALVGHVVEARSYVLDPTPFAVQNSSSLSVHFDSITARGVTVPLALSLRALADSRSSEEAESPQDLHDTGIAPTMIQIGGDSYSPVGTIVTSQEGDIVGYNRKAGVFARLLTGEYSRFNSSYSCAPTKGEQSVAIFSAGACGIYGFGGKAYIQENGKGDGGTFRLEAIGYNIELSSGSTALLQVLAPDSKITQSALPSK